MDVKHLLLVFKRSSFILTLLKHNLKVALLENAWTNHYSQPPNSTLGGLHMTQTIHDFVAHEQIPLEVSQNVRVVGGEGGLKIFYSKCFWAWLNFFNSTFANHLGGFF
jgi:hypothetical protein